MWYVCCYGKNTFETNGTSLHYYTISLGYVKGKMIGLLVVVYFTLHKCFSGFNKRVYIYVIDLFLLEK